MRGLSSFNEYVDERSPGGSRIERHELRVRPPERSEGDPELIDAMDAHLGKHLGDAGTVFHELVSDRVHVDVFAAPPTEDLPFHTLVTCGMSERPMKAPDDFPEGRFAEVMLRLPPEWPLNEQAFQDEVNYWPVRMLKLLARLPHEYETWLWLDHTVPNGDPPEPWAANTDLCGVMLLPPLWGPDGFEELTVGARQITLLAAVPVHADEMELKLEKGADALVDLLDAAEASELLDPARPSVVRPRRGFLRRR